MDIHFCRRCGEPVQQKTAYSYACSSGHVIYCDPSPATGLLLVNSKNELLLIQRGIDPGKGQLDVPGGFCDGDESLEQALAREVQEELHLSPGDYDQPQYLHSGIDPYVFAGETKQVLGVVFWARLRDGAQPKVGDDAAAVFFISSDRLDMQKIYFSVVRSSIQALRGILAKNSA